MQEKHLYEYAVIRILPAVEREEFLNVGIILFCKKEKYIKMYFTINEAKLALFCSDLDTEQVQLNLQAFGKIANGDEAGGPIALLDVASRFRWLTAVRSSVIQTSGLIPDYVLTWNKQQNACLKNWFYNQIE